MGLITTEEREVAGVELRGAGDGMRDAGCGLSDQRELSPDEAIADIGITMANCLEKAKADIVIAMKPVTPP